MESMSLDFGAVSWLAVGAAALVCWVSGFVWFGPKTLFPVWWRAMGKGDEQPGAGQNMGMVFGLVTLAAFLEAYVLAVVAEALAGGGDVTLPQGSLLGAVMGAAVGALSSRNGGRNLNLILILIFGLRLMLGGGFI